MFCLLGEISDLSVNLNLIRHNVKQYFSPQEALMKFSFKLNSYLDVFSPLRILFSLHHIQFS